MKDASHILVIRFSSMGDVAMTVPVIKNLLQQHPGMRITFLSNSFFEPLFDGIERCRFYPAFLKGKHKGFAGMFSLFKELGLAAKFDGIADLHNVLRSQLLGVFYTMSGHRVAVIEKGRQQKKALTRTKDKVLQQLPSTFGRYADVFTKLGFSITLQPGEPLFEKKLIPAGVEPVFLTGKKVIGVAPFAQYKEKMYPVEKMKLIVKELALKNHIVLLFGGGPQEAAILKEWENEIFSVFNVAAKYSFAEELAIISNLTAMVSMDSANMHLASLFNVPVVSIWGATHPFAGFYGWGQAWEHIVQVDLYCRPCSVFGNKPCYRGDHACMARITEQTIVEKIEQVIA